MASCIMSISSFNRISACVLIALLASTVAAPAQTAHFTGAQFSSLPIGGVTNPFGIAVDSSGTVYVADNAENSLFKLTPSGQLIGGQNFLSGEGSPYGVAVDGNGNVYFTESIRNEIIKETFHPSGGYYSKSVLPVSGLNTPHGIAVDAQGNVYVADYLNNRVVKATPSGNTYIPSTVTTSTLSLPEAVAVDGSGNLYIADTGNERVLKETLSATGYTESVVTTLENFEPKAALDIAADGAGDVFILEYEDYPDYAVVKETLSGGVYTQSTVPSGGQNPYGIAADVAGDVYMISPGTNRLLKEGPETNFGAVNVGSQSLALSLVFTFDTQSTLRSPVMLTQGAAALDFVNAGTGSCGHKNTNYLYNPGGTCSVDVIFRPQLSGNRKGAVVLQDASGNTIATAYISGTGAAPQISFPPGKQVSIATGLGNPSGVAVDGLGNVFFAENATGNLYKETVSHPGFARYTYSRNLIAGGLNHPTQVALDGAGNVYVAAAGLVYKETLSHGAYVQSQIVTDLSDLIGMAVDGNANLYLISSAAGDVHKETLQNNGSYTETAVGYGIATPKGVAVDGSGNIFILNAKDGDLYKEARQTNGSYQQTSVALAIAGPENLAVDGNGNVYVAAGQGEIEKLTLQADGSYVTTVALSGLSLPTGVAVDGQGNLYYAEDATGQLNMLDVADVPTLSFLVTKPKTTSADSPEYATLANIGNAPLIFPVPLSATNAGIVGQVGFVLTADSTCPVVGVSGVAAMLEAGSSCVYGVSFIPTVRGTLYSLLEWMDNNLNQAGGRQGILLHGTSVSSDSTRTTMRVNPSPVTAGLGVTITVTVTDTNTSATIVQGGVTLTDTVGGQALSLDGGAAVTLSDGKAVITMVPGVAGTHTITAHYGGVNDSFLSSTGTASLVVKP